MFWNTISNEERLRLWKTLRNDLVQLSFNDQITKVAKFCSTIPFGSRTLDYYSSEEWPTPWEILYYSSFCTSSISLLIYHTLRLCMADIQIALYLVEDMDDIYLLPVIDNQYVLNYELGQVNNFSAIQKEFTILKIYTQKDIAEIK